MSWRLATRMCAEAASSRPPPMTAPCNARDNRHAAILDPVESAVPSLGKKYSVPCTCIGEGTEVGASAKMLSLAKQDNDARLFGRIAKECLETGDRRFVQGISLGRARQAQQRYRAALAHSQSTRQDPP
jgi:hypothetical protein